MANGGAQLVIERVDTVSPDDANADLANEVVHIANKGAPVLLRGWRLSNGRGQEYVFPLYILARGGQVRVHTGEGDDSGTDLHWGLSEPVWKPQGDAVILVDDGGNEVVRHHYTGEPREPARAADPVSAPPGPQAQTQSGPQPEPEPEPQPDPEPVPEPQPQTPPQAQPQVEQQTNTRQETMSPRKRKLMKLPWLRPQKRR